MSEYINQIGGLTSAEVPKAPTNFQIQVVTGETNSTFNLSWTNNMSIETHPPTSEGYYVVAVQKIEAGATGWGIASTQNNLSMSSYSVSVDKTSRAVRYRVIVAFRSNQTGAYLATYPTQVLIAYPNRIQPEAVTDFVVDTSVYTNGWLFVEGEVGSTDTGGFMPRVLMTNPNIGNFDGYMRIYRILSATNLLLVHEDSQQTDSFDINGGDSAQYKFVGGNAGANVTLRVDCLNEDLIAKSEDFVVAVPDVNSIPDFAQPTDLEAIDIQSRQITLQFTSNSSGNYLVRGYVNNVPRGTPVYGENTVTVTFLNPNTTYNIYVRLTKAGAYYNSSTISVTTAEA